MKLKGIALKKHKELEAIYQKTPETEAAMITIAKSYERLLETEEQIEIKGNLYKTPTGKIEKSPLLDIAASMQKLINDQFKFLEKYKKKRGRF